jgi:hypothetical protein
MKRELEGYSSKYYSNYYNNSSGTWSGTYQFSDSLHDGVEHANLVADSNGEFIATWQEFSASETYLKEGRYNPASNSWSTRQINTDTSRGYYSLDLAKDDNDNLLLVGDRDSSLLGIVDMEVRLYDAETGTWGAPKLLEQSNFYVRDPHVAFGGNNHAIVIWRQYNGSKYDLWSARYIGQ